MFVSGPRRRGEGCDDEDQGIVAADETATRGARLRITLLAAGFIIGKLFFLINTVYTVLFLHFSRLSAFQVPVAPPSVPSPRRVAQTSAAGVKISSSTDDLVE